MPKKKKVIKPDIVLKNYWKNNEQFADLFNAVLFGGREIIKAEELEELDTEASVLMEHGDFVEPVEAARDNIKIQKKSSVYGVQFVLLALEHQEHIHYAMPMRIMGYDYSAYKKQYDSNANYCRAEKGLSKDEYLSRMRKTDKFFPVITILIYYGQKEWDGALSLHEMLEIPPELAEYVNDYKIRLIEAAKNNLKFHNVNNVDLFHLLELLNNKKYPLHKIQEKAVGYVKEHQVERSVLITVAGAANCKIGYELLEEKGETGMWKVFEDTRMEGVVEGRAEGIVEMGLEAGVSEEVILEKLMKKLGITASAAQEYLDKFRVCV